MMLNIVKSTNAGMILKNSITSWGSTGYKTKREDKPQEGKHILDRPW